MSAPRGKTWKSYVMLSSNVQCAHMHRTRETAARPKVLARSLSDTPAGSLDFKKRGLLHNNSCFHNNVLESSGLQEKRGHLEGVEEERVQLIGNLDVEDTFPLAATTAHGCQP